MFALCRAGFSGGLSCSCSGNIFGQRWGQRCGADTGAVQAVAAGAAQVVGDRAWSMHRGIEYNAEPQRRSLMRRRSSTWIVEQSNVHRWSGNVCSGARSGFGAEDFVGYRRRTHVVRWVGAGDCLSGAWAVARRGRFREEWVRGRKTVVLARGLSRTARAQHAPAVLLAVFPTSRAQHVCSVSLPPCRC